MEIKRLIVGALLTNCYLLISKNEPRSRETSLRGESAVVDPGGGAKEILKEIKNAKLNLKYIILTHSHIDHTFSALKIKQKTGAKILIHKEEKDFVKFGVDRFLKDKEKVKIGEDSLEVIHTPGHTKGSICLKGDNFIFTGDSIFKDGYGRTDLPGGSQDELKQSLKKLGKFFKTGMIIYPGHGEVFKIEKR